MTKEIGAWSEREMPKLDMKALGNMFSQSMLHQPLSSLSKVHASPSLLLVQVNQGPTFLTTVRHKELRKDWKARDPGVR